MFQTASAIKMSARRLQRVTQHKCALFAYELDWNMFQITPRKLIACHLIWARCSKSGAKYCDNDCSRSNHKWFSLIFNWVALLNTEYPASLIDKDLAKTKKQYLLSKQPAGLHMHIFPLSLSPNYFNTHNQQPVSLSSLTENHEALKNF